MTDVNFLIWKKAVKVYNSCTNQDQLEVAKSYIKLFLKRFKNNTLDLKFYQDMFEQALEVKKF